jgi:hypothetical protein
MQVAEAQLTLGDKLAAAAAFQVFSSAACRQQRACALVQLHIGCRCLSGLYRLYQGPIKAPLRLH